MSALKALLLNAVGGLLTLFIANALALGVQINIVTILICAVLGVTGAVLVILLALFDVAFAATIFL